MRSPLHASGRIEIIPAAIIGALALAAVGGFYVWRETATPPMMMQNVAAAPVATPPAIAPVAATKLPAPAHPRHLSPAKLVLALDGSVPQARPESDETTSHPTDETTSQSTKSPNYGEKVAGYKLQKSQQVIGYAGVDTAARAGPAVAPEPSIRIGHSHESDAIDPILLAAWQAYRNGDYDTSLQRYGEVLRKDAQNNQPPNRDALLGMAAIAQRRSQDASAAQYYSQVLALDPRDPDAHAGMSSLLGATVGTESRLKLLLAQRPEAAALHFALGNHYAGQSRWGDAQQAYFSACALESDNAQFAFNLAVSLDHLGQGILAAQHYRRAMQLDTASNTGFDRAQTQVRLDELASH